MSLKDFSNEKFDIIVLAGQSNAEGWGRGDVTEEYLPNSRILRLDDDLQAHFDKNEQGVDELFLNYPSEKNIAVADEPIIDGSKIGKMALRFAKNYLDGGYLLEDRKILVLYGAVGGTGFRDNQWGLGEERILYKRLKDLTQTALSLNSENRLVAFLWHQGECDSLGALPPDEKYQLHKKNLGAMIADYMETFGCKGIPLVAGGFVDEWYLKNVESCNPVLKAIKEVVLENNGEFVETSGLKSNNEQTGNGDDIHFCREASHLLGDKYFDAFKKLVK